MSSNEIISRKSRYSDKFDENSSLCNRSLKSEFNNLSVDLPHHAQHKHSSIEREIFAKRGLKAPMTVNLAGSPSIMQRPSTLFCSKSARRVWDGGCRILVRLGSGSSNGAIRAWSMRLCKS